MPISVAFWLVSTGMAFVVLIFLPAWVGTVWVLKGPHPRYVEKYPQLAAPPYTTRAGRISDLKARGLVIFSLAGLGLWAGVSLGFAFAAKHLFG